MLRRFAAAPHFYAIGGDSIEAGSMLIARSMRGMAPRCFRIAAASTFPDFAENLFGLSRTSFYRELAFLRAGEIKAHAGERHLHVSIVPNPKLPQLLIGELN
ncbi:hypothetical protein AQ611_20670 [Burkholderia singularis]|nr:hypothetical protein AQ611_20670 [Burkholderia sp. Bp7605]